MKKVGRHKSLFTSGEAGRKLRMVRDLPGVKKVAVGRSRGGITGMPDGTLKHSKTVSNSAMFLVSTSKGLTEVWVVCDSPDTAASVVEKVS